MTRHDDNSRPSMVDALIRMPGGAVPLEVVTDVSHGLMQQSASLARYRGGIPLPEGSQSWIVNMRWGARTSRLATTLPPLLVSIAPTGKMMKPSTALRDIGVGSIQPIDIKSEGGPRILVMAQNARYSLLGPDINGYVENFLEEAADVPRKLALAADGGPAHGFIWVDNSSTDGWGALRKADYRLPSTAPTLPHPITDLWVATVNVHRHFFRYSPDVGWERLTPIVKLSVAAYDLVKHAPTISPRQRRREGPSSR